MALKLPDRFSSAPGAHPPRADAMRRNFYVKPIGPERWEAISAIAANQFSSRAMALDWARAMAQRDFEMTGQPWGVKVWGPNGGWIYDTRLGAAADDGAA